MSECRAITNAVETGVATIAVTRWEGELSAEMIHKLRDIMEHRLPLAEAAPVESERDLATDVIA